jgi:hypothetical protein
LEAIDRRRQAEIVWTLFDMVKHLRIRRSVFGISVSLAVAWFEPVVVLMVGPRSA